MATKGSRKTNVRSISIDAGDVTIYLNNGSMLTLQLPGSPAIRRTRADVVGKVLGSALWESLGEVAEAAHGATMHIIRKNG